MIVSMRGAPTQTVCSLVSSLSVALGSQEGQRHCWLLKCFCSIWTLQEMMIVSMRGAPTQTVCFLLLVLLPLLLPQGISVLSICVP